MSRLTGRTYSRSQKDDASSKTFDEVFFGKPSTTKAASTIQRWGKASFTSTRGATAQTAPEGDSRKRRIEPTGQDSNDDPFSFDHEDVGPSKPKRGMGFKLKIEDLSTASNETGSTGKRGVMVEKSVNKKGSTDEILIVAKKNMTEKYNSPDEIQVEQKNGSSAKFVYASADKPSLFEVAPVKIPQTDKEKSCRERKIKAVNDCVAPPPSRPRTAARLAAKKPLLEDKKDNVEIVSNGFLASNKERDSKFFGFDDDDDEKTSDKISTKKLFKQSSIATFARKIDKPNEATADAGLKCTQSSLAKKQSFPRNRFFTSRGENGADNGTSEDTEEGNGKEENEDEEVLNDDVHNKDDLAKDDNDVDLMMTCDNELWSCDRDAFDKNGADVRMKIVKKNVPLVAAAPVKLIKDLVFVKEDPAETSEEGPIAAGNPWDYEPVEEQISFLRKQSTEPRKYGASSASSTSKDAAAATKGSIVKNNTTTVAKCNAVKNNAVERSTVKYTKVKDAVTDASSVDKVDEQVKDTNLSKLKDSGAVSRSDAKCDKVVNTLAKVGSTKPCSSSVTSVYDIRFDEECESATETLSKCSTSSRKPLSSSFNKQTTHVDMSISIIASSSSSSLSLQRPPSLPVKINLKGTLSVIESKNTTPTMSIIAEEEGPMISSASSSQKLDDSQKSDSSKGTVRRLLSGTKTVCETFSLFRCSRDSKR